MAMMNNGIFRTDDTYCEETWNFCGVSIRREAVYFVLSILAMDWYVISYTIVFLDQTGVPIPLPYDKFLLDIIFTAWFLIGIAYFCGISPKKRFHFTVYFILTMYAMIMSLSYCYQQEVKSNKTHAAVFISACIIIVLIFLVVICCINKKILSEVLNDLRGKWSRFARSSNSNTNPPDPNLIPMITLNGRSLNLEPDDSPRYIRLPLPGSEAHSRIERVSSYAVTPQDEEESTDYGMNNEARRLERLRYLANSAF